MANLGNLFYSVYVFNLPLGPIWVLHSFYLTSSALMLLWSLRYAAVTHSHRTTDPAGSQPCTPSTSRLSTSRP